MKRVSPLILSKKTPPKLLISFIIPDTSPEKREKKTRIITEALVLTSKESLKLPKEKVAAKEAEANGKQRKKEEREKQTKRGKETLKEKKKQEKEQRLKGKEEAKRLKIRMPPPSKKRKVEQQR